MQAIETRYNGYRFRSRLEARWAVFFDTLGVRYEYEKEGFHLDGGTLYLPDFWLPDHRCWVEIKAGPDVPFEDATKVIRLARTSGDPVVLLIGQPWPDEYVAMMHFYSDRLWFEQKISGLFRCQSCDLLHWAKFDGKVLVGWGSLGKACDVRPEMEPNELDDEALKDAYAAARTARFEHGETPDGPNR
jgi:hypothetical protein